ncbi:MAG: GPR endopeptidase [Clostridiales bacterium]|nr:GPR endopeptidase [Clostridiales bacterium]
MAQVRTDLAMESLGTGAGDMPGVHVSQWESAGVTITEVAIDREEGARLVGKPIGTYITLEGGELKSRDPDGRAAMASLLGEEIARLLPPPDGRPVLVIGLGNRQVTPDALGPRAVDATLVTRHLYRELPDRVDERMTSVCAVAPGVLGATGIETMEVARAIVRAVDPRAVIAIDALAARSLHRVGGTVQLTDTGIQPGSGVGNHRSALTSDVLGVPVVALGVPTVIYAVTIARDAMEMLSTDPDTPQRDRAMDAMVKELLSTGMGEMIVTPREVDLLIDDAAHMLASGINRALHPGLSDGEIATMM